MKPEFALFYLIHENNITVFDVICLCIQPGELQKILYIAVGSGR